MQSAVIAQFARSEHVIRTYFYVEMFNPSPGKGFFDVCRQRRGGGEMAPGISRVLEHIATKFLWLLRCFQGQAF